MNSIPKEIYNFLKHEGGKTLLVKGHPGAGKTIFSLEILNKLSKERTCFYLSTRVEPEKLFTQYPWIEGVIDQKSILDTSKVHKGPIGMFDLRLADAPDFLEKLHFKVKEIEKPLIVVDSWDGVAKKLDETSRLKAEEALIGIVDLNRDAGVIIVTEKIEQTTLDYLVDGIIVLSKKELENRTLREIELIKLRGVRINQPKYLFTLKDGRFHAFKPFRLKTKDFGIWDPIVDSQTHFSTGSEDLDKILNGGFPRGSIVLAEIDKNVPDFGYLLISVPVICNFLSQGRGIQIVPIGGFDVGELIKIGSFFLEETKIGNLVKISERVIRKEERKTDIVSCGLIDLQEENYKQWQKRRMDFKRQIDESSLMLIGISMCEQRFFEDHLEEFIAQETIRTKDEETLLIVYTFPGLEHITQKISNISTAHLKLRMINSCLTIFIEKPIQTEIFNVEMDVTKAFPTMKPTSIV